MRMWDLFFVVSESLSRVCTFMLEYIFLDLPLDVPPTSLLSSLVALSLPLLR